MNELDFGTAFKYPFNRAVGMLNILWILIPFLGIFAFFGYNIRIIQGFCRGEFKQLPTFKFGDNLKLGFFMALKMIPFLAIYMIIITITTKIHIALYITTMIIVGFFIIPILFINFFKKETMASLFEFKIIKSVFDNLGDYTMAILKSILLGLVFIPLWIVLVGIPAGSFTKNIFLADFYRRNIK